jgi:two-component system NarL family sensor kinase
LTDILEQVRGWVTREPSLATLLDRAAHGLAAALGADGCLVFRVTGDGDLVLTAPDGPGLRLPRGFGVTGRVAADGIPVVLVDDHPRNPRHRQLLGLAEGEPVSRLCVPARVPGAGSVAVLSVFSRHRHAFDEADVGTAQAVADLVGLRVHLAAVADLAGGYRDRWDNAVATTVALQEAERRRIAGDLHDGVTQAIASLTFRLSAAKSALHDGDIADGVAQVDAARTLADLAFGETRSAITGVRSPVLDDLGLAAGLVSLARSVPNLPIRVDAQDLPLPDHVATSLFRVAQEAVHNIVKHAAAGGAAIRLARRGRAVTLTVSDDGRGFEPASVLAPHGLRGMAERVHLIGGEFDLRSHPGQGTTVEARVPDVL